MKGNGAEFIMCFHADRAQEDGRDEAPLYPGITKAGEQKTRGKAGKIIENIISRLPNGAVVILSGVSRAIRTRSTLAVYADELENLLKNKTEIIVLNLAKSFPRSEDRLVALKGLSKEANNGRRKKIIVVHIPLTVEQFIASPDDGEEKAGELMLAGLENLQTFFRRTFIQSPLCIMSVGHSAALNGLFHRVIKERKKGFSFI